VEGQDGRSNDRVEPQGRDQAERRLAVVASSALVPEKLARPSMLGS